MFHVGQMVACVDDRRVNYFPEGVRFPVKGLVYTIRGFHRDGDAVVLEEIVNSPLPWRDGVYEPTFYLRRFKPVRTTDIDVFRKIVAPVKETA